MSDDNDLRDELRRLIEADLDGELGPEDRARVAAALQDDPELAAEAAELRRLRDLFRAVPPVSAPSGFAAGVVSRAVDSGPAVAAASGGVAAPASPRLRLLRAAPWVAGLAAACLLAVMMGPWSDDGAPRGDTAVATADAPTAEKSLAARSDDESPRRQAFEQQETPGALEGSGASEERAPTRRSRGVASPEPDPDAVDGRRAGGKSRARSGPARPLEPATTTEADAPEMEELVPAEAAADLGDMADAAGARDDETAGGTGAGETVVGEAVTGETGAPSKDASAPPARAEKPDSPLVPPAVTAEAPATQPGADDSSREFGARAKVADLARGAAPTRRYVVFEDEAAARRFVASLRSAIEKKSAVGAKKGPVAAGEADAGGGDGRDGGPDPPGGPTTGGPDTGGPATGGGGGGGSSTGRSLPSGAGLAGADRLASQASAPRVLERVTLATTDPIVGRVFARAPEGGVFGEGVSAELLDLAEASAKLREAEELRTEADRTVADRTLADEELERDGGVVAGGAGAGGSGRETVDVTDTLDPPADEPVAEGAAGPAPSAPQPAGMRKRRATDNKNANAEIEIVVVVVPRGTLPPTVRPSADER